MGCASSETYADVPQGSPGKKVTRKISVKEIMEMMGAEKWVEAIEALQTLIEDHGDE